MGNTNKKNIKKNDSFRVVVVGASAGGIHALAELTAQLRGDMNIAVFIVLHLSRTSLGGYLVTRLQSHTPFTCKTPEDGEAIQAGTIYIAPADRHLLVKKDQIVIGQGPEENRWRPSIDVLFRSAAVAYGPRVIGIVLTGLLDDGASGMLGIQRAGGTCVVQDPNEAEFPDMPLAVLGLMEADHCLPLADMGELIAGLAQSQAPAPVAVPKELVAEAAISEKVVISLPGVSSLGENSIFACPDCGGGLWEVTEKKTRRYRCHIGHAYSESDLVLKQSENLEETLWVALRIMEERRNLLLKIGEDYKKRGLSQMTTGQQDKAATVQVHIDRLKEVLFAAQEV